jgi:dihydroxyacetone kinase
VHKVWLGEYATSLEMAGASISLLQLDAELTQLVDAPAESPFFVQR